jgi:hypothetical protein
MPMFKPCPAERFAAFHREFQGDTWDTCERCGGKCEINKIGSLMPGETEFIATSLGCAPADFRRRYLDGIETPFGLIDVLKIKKGCPFLSADFRCTIKEVKVVLCEVYPIAFEVEADEVVFKLDPWCPITRLVPELARQFEERAIPALQRLGVPVDWYRAVALYDWLNVDYTRLQALRADNMMDFLHFTLNQLRACQAEDAPPPPLKPPRPGGRSFGPLCHPPKPPAGQS